MSANTEKFILSGTPANGRPIRVVTIISLGDIVHTALVAPTLDEIWLYAVATGAADRALTIEFGGAAAGDLLPAMNIPLGQGLVTVLPGIPLTGGLIVRAFADVTNEINLFGFVNRIVN